MVIVRFLMCMAWWRSRQWMGGGWWGVTIHDHSSCNSASLFLSPLSFSISNIMNATETCSLFILIQQLEKLPPPRNYKGNQGMSTKFSMVSGDSFNFSDEPTTPNLYLTSSEPSSWALIVDPSLTEVTVSHNDLFIDALGVKFQLTSEQKGDLQGLPHISKPWVIYKYL